MAAISLRNVVKRYGTRAEGEPGDPRRQRRDRRRRVHRHRRALGLRQVDAAAHGGGLEEISGGEICDRRPRGQQPRAGRARHRDGVPELRALPAHERVRQHGLRPEDRQGADATRSRRASTRPPKILELGHLLERKPRELSGGQRQRVAMGRAIVRQPQVFLFDEPLSNLDAKLRAQTRLEIQKLHRELGITSLFVTHDQVEAMTLAQRMIVMNAGVMEQIGTPEEVYHRPATTFVASFIGSPPMNLLKHAPGVRPGTILGIRPEHLDARRERLVGAGRARRAAGRRAADLRPHRRRAAHHARSTKASRRRPSATRCKIAARQDKLHWFDAGSRQAHRHEHAASTACRAGPTRAGSRTAAPASWRPRTRWPPSASAPSTATACSSATSSCSADGVPFLLHDATLERTTNGHGIARRAALGRAGAARRRRLAFARATPASRCPRSKRSPASASPTATRSTSRSSRRRASSARPARSWRAQRRALWAGAAAAAAADLVPARGAARRARGRSRELPRGLLLDTLRDGWLDDGARRSAASPSSATTRCGTPPPSRRCTRAGMRALSYTVNDEWAGAAADRARHRRHHHRPRRPVQPGGLRLARRRCGGRDGPSMMKP